jgi:hypothetical protein
MLRAAQSEADVAGTVDWMVSVDSTGVRDVGVTFDDRV